MISFDVFILGGYMNREESCDLVNFYYALICGIIAENLVSKKLTFRDIHSDDAIYQLKGLIFL